MKDRDLRHICWERFRYDTEDGKLYIKTRYANRVRIGDEAGGLNARGYRQIGINGTLYLTHRLVWLMCYGAFPPIGKEIDHINGNKTDNRIANLRSATRAENLHNAAKHKDNSSGHKGVSWFERGRKWRARINSNGKAKHLGYYRTAEEAAAAYAKASASLHGEYGRVK